jgi:hypothetical protein
LAGRSETEPWKREELERYDFSTVKAKHKELIERSAEAPKPLLLAILPRGQQYVHAYKKRYSAKAEAEMRTGDEKFKELQALNPSIVQTGTADSLLSQIKNSTANPVIIVGHTEGTGKDQRLMMPDGEPLKVEDIMRAGLESNHPCIVVTCHGEDVGVHDEISLTTAYDICRRAEAAFKSGQTKTVKELLLAMRHEATVWVKPGVSIVFLVAATGTGAALGGGGAAGTGSTSGGGTTVQMVVANYEGPTRWWLWALGGFAIAGGGFASYRFFSRARETATGPRPAA